MLRRLPYGAEHTVSNPAAAVRMLLSVCIDSNQWYWPLISLSNNPSNVLLGITQALLMSPPRLEEFLLCGKGIVQAIT